MHTQYMAAVLALSTSIGTHQRQGLQFVPSLALNRPVNFQHESQSSQQLLF